MPRRQVPRKKFSLVVLPVAHMDTQRQIRTLEMTGDGTPLSIFILKKKISKMGPDDSFAVKQLASSYQAPGTRLHRKLRKRLNKLGALSLYSSSKQEPESSWMILTVFSEKSLASCNLQRMLRSSAFSLQHLYAVHRLSNNLDEPPRLQGQCCKVCCRRFWCLNKGGGAPQIQTPADSSIVSQRIQRNYKNLAETSCHFKKRLFSSVSPSSLQCRSCCTPFAGQVAREPSQDDGRFQLGYTTTAHMPCFAKTAS